MKDESGLMKRKNEDISILKTNKQALTFRRKKHINLVENLMDSKLIGYSRIVKVVAQKEIFLLAETDNSWG